MGQVLKASAGVDRIDGYLVEANARATARGGEVAAAAASRLGVFLAAIAGARTAFVAAKGALVVALAGWAEAERTAYVVLGSVFDDMRAVLGRPARHPALQAFLPGGVSLLGEADRGSKAALLQQIASRLVGVSAPPWTDAQRAAWAAAIEGVRAPLAGAMVAADGARAGYALALGTYGAQAREGLRALGQLKRDLKYLGMTEAQVTEIIPNVSRRGAGGEGGATVVVDVGAAPAVLPAATSGAAGSSPPAGS